MPWNTWYTELLRNRKLISFTKFWQVYLDSHYKHMWKKQTKYPTQIKPRISYKTLYLAAFRLISPSLLQIDLLSPDYPFFVVYYKHIKRHRHICFLLLCEYFSQQTAPLTVLFTWSTSFPSASSEALLWLVLHSSPIASHKCLPLLHIHQSII